MKKALMIWLVLLFTVTFVWCSDSWNDKISESDYAVVDDYEWWWEWIAVMTDMCEEEWWKIGEIEDDEWETQEACLYSDWSYCELNDLSVNQCYSWLMMID